jgi:hypothetical protein
MGCAAFTLLGIWVLFANKSNAWALQATFGLAAFCLFWACFLAWRDKEREVQQLAAKLRMLETLPSATPVQHIYLPTPLPKVESPKHNVRCLGVEIEDICVTICFQNVPIPGEPVGDFENARLCVEYMDGLTGIEWVTVFPARWIDDGQGKNAVGITPRRAFLASFYKHDDWRALPSLEGTSDLSHQERIDGLSLPSRCLKVKVTLVGEKNLTLAPVVGFLTLRDDGQAAWEASVQ